MRCFGGSTTGRGVVLPLLKCSIVKYKTIDKPITMSNKPMILMAGLLIIGSPKRLFNEISNNGMINQIIDIIKKLSENFFIFMFSLYQKTASLAITKTDYRQR